MRKIFVISVILIVSISLSSCTTTQTNAWSNFLNGFAKAMVKPSNNSYQPSYSLNQGSGKAVQSASANSICNCKGYAGLGGPCYDGLGGPAYAGLGGPAYAGLGGPCYDGLGGPEYDGLGGPAYSGLGGPRYDGLGGPAYDGLGGPAYDGLGGPCYAGLGGPCYSGLGGTGVKCPSVCK